MKVNVRIFGYDIPDAKNTEMELPDGATVADLLKRYLSVYDIGLTEEEFSHSHFLINKRADHLGAALHDGDELTILRILGGG